MSRHARKWLVGILPTILWLASAGAYGSTAEVSGKGEVKPSPVAAPLRPAKPAWRWTVEERIARRFAPEAMKARVIEQRTEQSARRKLFSEVDDGFFTAEGEDTASVMDALDGKKHPELFFPDELFVHLLVAAFPPGGEFQGETRRPIEERAAALGFGRDLWPRLAKVAAPLLKLEAEQERLGPSPSIPKNGYGLDARSLHFCRARAQTIAAAKAEFGEEAFLRLLYEAVAPEVNLLAFGPGPGPEDADHSRYLAGGCR